MRYQPQHLAPRAPRKRLRAFRRAGAATVVMLAGGAVLNNTLVGADAPATGVVSALGAATNHGAAAGQEVAGIARTPSGNGYWLTTRTGRVFGFGDAELVGSLEGAAVRSPIVDIAAAPEGQGYWLVARDGNVFAFGTAQFSGSKGTDALNQPIVGIAATPSGQGYWMAAADGGVFTFGDAAFHGSAAGQHLNEPIVGIAASPTGSGYWMAARDGGTFAFGDATFAGSPGDRHLNEPVVGISATPSGQGYWLVARDGGVFTYGDAVFHGSLTGQGGAPVVDVSATPDGEGTWVATGGKFLGNFDVTCYALRGRTASGKFVGRTLVAVDPRVIPLGTEIFIGGEGTRVAADTGGNIKGRRLDIWRPSVRECREFGRKTMPVYLPAS